MAPLANLAQKQAGRLTHGTLGAARRNPGAVAMIGMGLGLFVTGKDGRGETGAGAASGLPAGALVLGAGALAAALVPALRRRSGSETKRPDGA